MADSKTVLKWVALGCGGALLLAAAGGVAMYHFVVKPARAKFREATKESGLDFSRGFQGLGGQAIDLALQGQRQFVLPLLPKEDVPSAVAMYGRLHQKASHMRKEDIEGINAILERYNKRMDEHRRGQLPLDAIKEDTRAFVAELGKAEAQIPD
jgi:hypothetical protein